MVAPEDAIAGEREIAIEARGLTKRYDFRSPRGFLRRSRGPGQGPGFTALQDVDLTVRRGERVGIVGRNGAGKTTLLRLVAGTSPPTSGSLRVDGSVQALMELGVGFHPEFTGRQNVRSSLIHLGLAGDELDAAIEQVIEFVELGDFLNQPLLTYSLGMQARVMFATATVVRPDILVVDEVLGSGDPYFTAKCADRMSEMVREGCTLLLVSHAPQQMLHFCDRAIWIDRGRVIQDGDAVDTLNAYEAYLEWASESMFALRSDGQRVAAEHGGRAGALTRRLADGREVHSWPGNSGVVIQRVAFLRGNEAEPPIVGMGEPVRLEVDIFVEKQRQLGLRYLITFWRSDGRRAARVENTIDRFVLEEAGLRRIRFDLGPMLLGPGRYGITFAIYDVMSTTGTSAGRAVRYDAVSRAIQFAVEARPGDVSHPATVLPGRWRMGPAA